MSELQTICIIGAADNLYAQHLAVAFVSLLVNLAPGWKCRFYVADGDITPENRLLLTRSVQRHGGEIKFLKVEREHFNDLFIAEGRHITQASYYRLVIPEMLRDEPVEKVIYLDCDLIVRDDISQMLLVPIGDHPIGAVEDLGGAFRLADLCIPEGSAYFNSGVLLINLPKWRDEDVSNRVFRFVRENPHRMHYHDQDGLNAVLHGRWLHLHPKWNVQRNMFGRIDAPPDKIGMFKQAVKNPSIVHFTGNSKPWHYDNAHPYKKEYYRYLSLTEWKHFKPAFGLKLMFKKWARLLLPDALLSFVRRYRFR
ncbi:glycosyltransferase family 8 protein [Cohnella sp. CFH 77786]|uniref:glycosyltransferase family 8 protein n=1 Tax=Cohnella sp. CFH 77786 TaxID=2662265 RepID=UPI001C6096F6|nr:glycosyltransferase family 8 protein [Cohnella sp. CFH 77786]MBW5448339.1 glycosyltransferase family 8 protein [Cohnella sp. CFH 77786]